MAIAAHTAGAHSTLHLLIGIAVLIWALAGAAALAGWLTRSARRKRRGPIPSLVGALRARVRRLKARAGGAGDSASTPTASTEAPSRGVRSTAAAESSASTTTRAAPASAETPTGVIADPCVSPETLEALGQRVDNSRRLAVARARLGEVLSPLPGDRWFVERNVVFAAHPIPFLILGETGVFALWGRPDHSSGVICRSTARWPQTSRWRYRATQGPYTPGSVERLSPKSSHAGGVAQESRMAPG